VKPNVGHLDNAAGIANIIKAALAIKHKQLPPSVNYDTPNPAIRFEETPFVVSTRLTEWADAAGHPRRAGVSSYGVGGTNAHVILEEYIPSPAATRPPAPALHLIPVSARSENALHKVRQDLVAFLENHPETRLADVAHTLQNGRRDFAHRTYVLAATPAEAIEKLKAAPAVKKADDVKTVFLFPGQGAQYLNMARELYGECASFRDTLDEGFALYAKLNQVDLKGIIFNDAAEAGNWIYQTRYSQPLLFLFEYALARLLMACGVKPDYMIGHSIGEYTASCISGVLDLEDAIAIVSKRGELMQSLPTGSMLALMLDRQELETLLPPDLSLAAVNSARMSVVSGTHDAIEAFQAQLRSRNIEGRKLHTSHAFHSHMMDPILEAFEKVVGTTPVKAPQIKYLSNLTGNWTREEDLRRPSYWSSHLRSAVLFKDGVEKIPAHENTVFIEVGPGNTLGTFVKRLSPEARSRSVYSTIRHPQENASDVETLYTLLGRLWQKGIDINWSKVFTHVGCQKVSLPLYAFERKKYWVGGNVYQLAQGAQPAPAGNKFTEKLNNRWIYKPTWSETTLGPDAGPQPAPQRLVFSDGSPFTRYFLGRESAGNPVVIEAGKAFEARYGRYTIDPAEKSHYKRLLEALKDTIGDQEIEVLHFWSLDADPDAAVSAGQVKAVQQRGLLSILYLVQCISAVLPKAKVRARIVSNNIHNVRYRDLHHPLNATLLGAVTTVPLEYKNITMQSIDLDAAHLREPATGYGLLKPALDGAATEQMLAFRGEKLYARTFEPVALKHEANLATVVKDAGVYLVTGGLGGIGIEMATYLSGLRRVKLALLGRSDFPERDTWPALIRSGGAVADRIRRIQEMEKNGSEVMVLRADVADAGSMRSCVARVRDAFGRVDGVLHCAGVAGGNIIQTLDTEYVYDTMASKVFGTLTLEEVLDFSTLDFAMLCSSISSITGTFGQLSYTAANSFLDAFTHFRNSRGPKNVICFNWDIWQEVGMATKALRELNREDELQIPARNLLGHPLVTGYLPKNDDTVFVSHLDPRVHWVMDEHRILKQPVLPGATYVEILALIAGQLLESPQFVISNLNFYAPFTAPGEAEKTLVSVLTKEEGGYAFAMKEKYSSDKEGVCVKGKLRRAAGESLPAPVDVAGLVRRCDGRTIADAARELNKDTAFLELGPRWTCLRTIHLGETEGVAVIEMPAAFAADFAAFRFHPAILDIAFNYFAAWKIGQQEYLPFSYKNLVVHQPIAGGRLYSHVQQNAAPDASQETISFRVQLLSESGAVLLSIEEYVLKKVYSDKVKADARKFAPAAAAEPAAADSKDALLAEGILSSEGAAIFDTLLTNLLLTGSADYTQLVVSNNNLDDIRESAAGSDAYAYFKPGKADDKPFTDRPDLSDLYEAPAGKVQEQLCVFFQNFLRINQLGIHDNFFELGISSLDVVEIKIGVEQEFRIELPVAVIFERPTIKALAQFVGDELGGTAQPAAVETAVQLDTIQEGRSLLRKRMAL